LATLNSQNRYAILAEWRLSALSQDPALVQVARKIEEKTIQMVDEAK
jgi:hypothetical protein